MPRLAGVSVNYMILGGRHVSCTITHECRVLFLVVASSRNRTKGYRLKGIIMLDSRGNIGSTLNWLPMTTLVKNSGRSFIVGIPGMYILQFFFSIYTSYDFLENG